MEIPADTASDHPPGGLRLRARVSHYAARQRCRNSAANERKRTRTRPAGGEAANSFLRREPTLAFRLDDRCGAFASACVCSRFKTDRACGASEGCR